MKMKRGFVEDIAAVVAVAFALGYLGGGLTLFFIPETQNSVILNQKNPPVSREKFNDDVAVVYRANIFGIKIRQLERKIKKQQKVRVVSNIDGYILVGFVSTKNPMVLFKKHGEPVKIVTKNKGLNGLWMLYRINPDSVDLKNKKTGEIKRFRFKEKLSNILRNFHLPNTSPNRLRNAGGVEKIVLPRTILSELKDINRLFNQINITPAFNNGKPIGYKINYLSGNCVLRKAGLRVGDIIVSVNGQPTTDPQRIMDMFSQLSQMTSVSIDIIRGGTKKTIFVEIQ